VELVSFGTQSKLGSVVPVDIKGWLTPSVFEASFVFLELELSCAKLLPPFDLKNEKPPYYYLETLKTYSRKVLPLTLQFVPSVFSHAIQSAGSIALSLIHQIEDVERPFDPKVEDQRNLPLLLMSLLIGKAYL
jgi:hypothetical protein